MISFLVAAVATVAAVVATGLLARECARSPRLEVVPWLVAAAGLALGLGALALGYKQGFGPGTFRAVQLGAQLLASLALVWGLVEVTGQSLAARFATRLLLAGFFVVAAVIMAIDPLSSTPFTTAWPPASQHYLIIPNGLLLLIAVGTVLTALVAVAIAGARRGRGPGGPQAFAVTATGAGAAVALQLLRLALPVNAAYPAVCLAAAALIWFAGIRSDVSQLSPSPARGRERYEEDDDYGGLYRPGDTGGYRRYPDDTGYGPDAGYGPGGPDAGYGTYGGRDISDTGYGFYREDTGGLRAISDTGYGLYRDDNTGSMVFSDGPGANGMFGSGDTGLGLGMGGDGEGTDRLYGQIAIYTLLDGRTEEFDQLAQDVVAKVKDREPETLVFVMHGVPSAPMQRILYEVYRDQAAYEEHADQAYIREWEERRKPYVLATNVIELGVRQAKVSPLGSGAAAGPDPGPAAPRTARSRAPAGDDLPRAQHDLPRAQYDLPRAQRDLPRAQPGLPRAQPDLPGPPPGLPRSQPPEPSRSRPVPAAPRRAAPPPPEPDESGVWTREPADTPEDGGFWGRPPADSRDDGDFWSRGSGYR